MAFDTDAPPHKSAEPLPPHAPADDDHPNVAMLKADIDSGRTGDKVEVFDPGMAMLGTCEEAAGTPLQPEQIKMIREYETKRRWRLGSKKTGAAHEHGPNYALYGFGGFIALVAVAFLGVIWMA